MPRKPSKVRHLLDRDGRYFARLVVPASLQPIIGKRELLEPLGPDRADAIVRLHGAVARFHQIIAEARRGVPPAPPPISVPHAVHDLYRDALRRDDFARYRSAEGGQTTVEYNRLFASAYLHTLRKIAGGFLSRDEINEGLVEAAIGQEIDDALQGKERPARGTKAWLDLAKALAAARGEAIERSRERDAGDFKGKPEYELLTSPPPVPKLETAPLSIAGMLDTYLAMLARSGRGVEAGKRWRPVFRDLNAFLGHDDARRVTKADIHRWVEHLRKTKAEKTIKDSYLGSVKAVFGYAADHDTIEANPASKVKIRTVKPIQNREKGYTIAEGTALLKESRKYQAKEAANPAIREGEALVAAKRWAPILCAFTGSRISEVTQLRKEDIREQDGIAYIRFTPAAGSIKNRQYRDVPVHRQVVEEGFLAFVAQAPDGPLFYRENQNRRGTTHPSKTVSGRVSQWIRTLKIVPLEVQPNHGWRHALKTLGREVGVDTWVLDAIQGHKPRTAGENYGDVTLKAKDAAMSKIPHFAL